MRTENQVFLPNILCLTIPKKLVVTTSEFQIIWDLENFHAYHGFLSIFLSHSTEKLREEPSNVSESFKCQVSKNFMHKKVITRFPVENFLSRPEKFLWRTLRYIRKVRLSKNFMTKRLITLFSVEFFPRIPPLKFIGEPLCVSESLGPQKLLCSVGAAHFSVGFSGIPILKSLVGKPFSLTQYFSYRNFLGMRTENQVFLPNILCLIIPKKLVVTTSEFQIIWDLENFHAYHGFLSIFLSHSTEKLREEPSNVPESFKCQVSKNFMHKNVISRFPVENFLSRPENIRWGTLRYIRKVRLSKNFMTELLISLFSIEFFSRILPIKFVGEPLCVSESLGLRKRLCSVGGNSRFSVVFLWHYSTDNLRG